MNMTLNEAVERLRGDVDTNVDVYVERDSAPGVQKFTITRAFIRPPAIDPPAPVMAAPAGDRSAGPRAGGPRWPWPARREGRVLPHAALLREQRGRSVGRAGAV